MSFIVVDVEADGPIPAEFSMVCFGAVVLDDDLNKTKNIHKATEWKNIADKA